MVRTKAVGLKSGSRAITVPIRQVGYGVQRPGGELNRRRVARENYPNSYGTSKPPHHPHLLIFCTFFPVSHFPFFYHSPGTFTSSKTKWSPLSSPAVLMS